MAMHCKPLCLEHAEGLYRKFKGSFQPVYMTSLFNIVAFIMYRLHFTLTCVNSAAAAYCSSGNITSG